MACFVQETEKTIKYAYLRAWEHLLKKQRIPEHTGRTDTVRVLFILQNIQVSAYIHVYQHGQVTEFISVTKHVNMCISKKTTKV